ncbi:hypothetical protein C8F01DRAFT_1161091 [Mycena amicta]|nr:hypothetical protein C8F01DRAFT_1161091 [Mycena amicta]
MANPEANPEPAEDVFQRISRVLQEARDHYQVAQSHLADAEAEHHRLDAELVSERQRHTETAVLLDKERKTRQQAEVDLRILQAAYQVFFDSVAKTATHVPVVSGDSEEHQDVKQESPSSPPDLTMEDTVARGSLSSTEDPDCQLTALNPVADPELETVRSWRFTLQKRFLGYRQPPMSAAEGVEMDELFTVLENYGDRMRPHYLLYSKIGKVLHHISLLDPTKLSGNEEFKFCDCAHALVEVYSQIRPARAQYQADTGAEATVTVEDTSMEGYTMVDTPSSLFFHIISLDSTTCAVLM